MILRLTLSLRRFKAREKIKLKIKLLTLTEVKRFGERFMGLIPVNVDLQHGVKLQESLPREEGMPVRS